MELNELSIKEINLHITQYVENKQYALKKTNGSNYKRNLKIFCDE